MDLKKLGPLVIYDNHCYLCARFAGFAAAAARGRIRLVGHYSDIGMMYRKPLGADALEMFWFVLGDTAYGGRAALIPLLKTVLFGKKIPQAGAALPSNPAGCKNVGAVFLRSASLFSHSRRVNLGQV